MSDTAIPTLCVHCEKSLRIPPGADGKRIRCPDCGAIHRILATGDAYRLFVEGTPDEEPADPAAEPGASCPGCGQVVAPGEAFCSGCGKAVSDDTAAAARIAGNRADSKARRAKLQHQQRTKKVRSAAGVLLLISIIFAIAGTFFGFKAREQAEQTKAQLATMAPDDELEVAGERIRVDDLRRGIDGGVALVFGINYGLAVVMLALFFWARSSPFPALLIGLCVYLGVQVMNVIFDPTTLWKGLVMKVFVVMSLVGGLSAALATTSGGRRRREGHRSA